MNIFMHGFFIVVIVYFYYQFVLAMIKMKQNILLPNTEEERATLYIYPQKSVAKPLFAEQKVGIIIYSGFLIYLVVIYCLGVYFIEWNWTLILLLLLPILNMGNLINLFVITEDGIVRGLRFVPWKKVKAYELSRIDISHKFYGVSEEINQGYELKIHTRGFPLQCFVTNEETLNRIVKIFQKYRIDEYRKDD